MTNADCISDLFEPEVSPSNNRQLKVGSASRYPDYTRIPTIMMKGQWLEEAGFTTDTKVNVRVMNGCIVLTAKRPEPELVQSLRQMRKLSARKQKQVQEFIEVITGKARRLA
ncbi:endoribonuclease SymE [Leminorella richardii]|uniref:endoribonuclease SymE n=1 Tax=Leminorella richardii TaxID=158841 RepID=UPI000DBE46CF|nr:endoribonuclease SymE [Leminorella richardii]